MQGVEAVASGTRNPSFDGPRAQGPGPRIATHSAMYMRRGDPLVRMPEGPTAEHRYLVPIGLRLKNSSARDRSETPHELQNLLVRSRYDGRSLLLLTDGSILTDT